MQLLRHPVFGHFDPLPSHGELQSGLGPAGLGPGPGPRLKLSANSLNVFI
ncbi:unnamed protein product, partial [Adineta steineri]